jgi:hypothetical protein
MFRYNLNSPDSLSRRPEYPNIWKKNDDIWQKTTSKQEEGGGGGGEGAEQHADGEGGVVY